MSFGGGLRSFFGRVGVGGIKFEFWWGFYFSTRHLNFTLNRYSVPSGFRRDLHNEAEGRVYGWDGMGRGIKSVLQYSSYFVGI